MKILSFLVKLLGFIPFFATQVVRSNLQVIHDVLTHRNMSNPAFLEIPLTLVNPWEIFIFTNLITMTPGTICLDISEDHKALFVHVMFYSGDEIRQEFQDLERRVGGLFS